MRAIKNLENHIRTVYAANLPTSTTTDLDQRVLRNAMNTINKVKKASSYPKNIWREIMKSKTTKLSTAAAVLVAMIFGTYIFLGDGTTITLADIIEHMHKKPWMHAVFETSKHLEDSGITQQTSDIKESWTSLDPYRHIQISVNGDISFIREDSGRLVNSRYDPTINTITVSYQKMDGGVNSEMPNDFLSLLLTQIEELEKEGVDVRYTKDTYDDCPVWIIDFEDTGTKSNRLRGTLIVDLETRLPIELTVDSNGGDQQARIGRSFSAAIDYPDVGPTTIYQAGAPKEAGIKEIDDGPPGEFGQAMQEYRKARESLADQYILVEILIEDSSLVQSVTVTHRDRQNKRRQKYDINREVELPGPSDGLKSVMDWLNGLQFKSYNMIIEDGEYTYGAYPGEDGTWSVIKRKVGSVIQANSWEDFPNLGWPLIDQGENPFYSCRQIQSGFAVQNDLICFELYSEGLYEDNKVHSPASRIHYYVDPQRDYLCVRQENYVHNSPSLRKQFSRGPVHIDKLDFDPRVTPSEPINVIEVVESCQTDTGQWYPKIIRKSLRAWQQSSGGKWESSPRSEMIWVYFDTHPALPEGIFDLKNLPK